MITPHRNWCYKVTFNSRTQALPALPRTFIHVSPFPELTRCPPFSPTLCRLAALHRSRLQPVIDA